MIADVPLQVLIDTGASINVIDEKTFHPPSKRLSNLVKTNACHLVSQQQRFTAIKQRQN